MFTNAQTNLVYIDQIWCLVSSLPTAFHEWTISGFDKINNPIQEQEPMLIKIKETKKGS